MWTRWFPWRFIIRRVARAQGFLDPITLLAHFNRFAKPAEVLAPTELLRAGIVLHARGLVNSQAIQHNLDWVWPFWVEQQFDPRSRSFIPRAFSMTHINLTHRNWTAIGMPGESFNPIVDPRGLVTPFYDGWSLDAWILDDDGRETLPSRMQDVSQCLDITDGLRIVTTTPNDGQHLQSTMEVRADEKRIVCAIRYRASAARGGWLAVSLRPYNPEGVSFVHEIELSPDAQSWRIERKQSVAWNEAPDEYRFSRYGHGDVYQRIRNQQEPSEHSIVCETGMATAAVMFRLDSKSPRDVNVEVPFAEEKKSVSARHGKTRLTIAPTWDKALEGTCVIAIDDDLLQGLYQRALRTLILHASDDLYAGPYVYKRFWFRDAALICHTMACCGLTDTAHRSIGTFFARQNARGHFISQEGEWDSNGQVLWLMKRFCELSGEPLPSSWLGAVRRAVAWIRRKRIHNKGDQAHDGLLPPGFSAEHLGPNDCYYWDNFWSVAGLRAAAEMLQQYGESSEAGSIRNEAHRYLADIERSLNTSKCRIGSPAMPASPTRRLDSGAVGSLVVGYPLQLWPARDERLMQTAEFLLTHCMVDNAFFHDISHSGINPYLTLHIAQVLLRAGDHRYRSLMMRIAELASPTGQWPEAIHPQTGAGCMGDGQHVWAAAEWIMMLRNCFVREEMHDNKLVLCAGVDSPWYQSGTGAMFGPAPTPFGAVTVRVRREGRRVAVEWNGAWRTQPDTIDVALPGYKQVVTSGREKGQVLLTQKEHSK